MAVAQSTKDVATVADISSEILALYNVFYNATSVSMEDYFTSTLVLDIFVFDSEGELLADVLLIDTFLAYNSVIEDIELYILNGNISVDVYLYFLS